MAAMTSTNVVLMCSAILRRTTEGAVDATDARDHRVVFFTVLVFFGNMWVSVWLFFCY